MTSYDVRFFVGWVLGQGYYMRFIHGRSVGDTLRWTGLGLLVGIPLYLGAVWIINHFRHP